MKIPIINNLYYNHFKKSIAIILLAIAVIFISGYFFKIEMFIPPYDANIWGTVSDWLMIVVTALTAIFLYKTLKSQLTLQELQQDIVKIEKYKHRHNIMPFMLLSHLKEETKYFFYVTTTKNDAIDFCLLIHEQPGHTIVEKKKHLLPKLPIGSSRSAVIHLFLPINVLYIPFEAIYKDAEGNCYLQRLCFWIKNNVEHCESELPQLITLDKFNKLKTEEVINRWINPK